MTKQYSLPHPNDRSSGTDFVFDRVAFKTWANDVQEIVRSRGDNRAVEEIEHIIKEFDAERFVIGVMGKAKRGKSTLINAILGRNDDRIAPVDKLPASSAITRIGYGERESADVQFLDGRREEIPLTRIREFVTEELNPENAKRVAAVDVTCPFAGIDRDVELVDTPGAGSIHDYHDILLQAFIPRADAIVFLFTARMPLDRDELELLGQIKQADVPKIFFALNRIDESSADEIDDAIRHNQQVLAQAGLTMVHMHRISARTAFRGDRTASGLDDFLADIRSFVGQNKGRILHDRAVQRIIVAAAPVFDALNVELAAASRSTDQVQAEIAALQKRKQDIEKDRELIEKEFKLAWSRAVDDFERNLEPAKRAVQTKILDRIQDCPLGGISELSKNASTLLANAVDDALGPHSVRLEQSLHKALETIDVGYPALDVGSDGQVSVRTRGDSTLYKGAALSVATAGTGLAMTVAAGIAATATTTVVVPSAIGGLAGLIPASMGPFGTLISGVISGAGTGTATIAGPSAIFTVLGPPGWVLMGIGLVAVPIFAWRKSKGNLKEQLEIEIDKAIRESFRHLQSDRIPALRRMASSIVEEFQVRLDRKLQQIETALASSSTRTPDAAALTRLRTMRDHLETLLQERRPVSPSGTRS